MRGVPNWLPPAPYPEGPPRTAVVEGRGDEVGDPDALNTSVLEAIFRSRPEFEGVPGLDGIPLATEAF